MSALLSLDRVSVRLGHRDIVSNVSMSANSGDLVAVLGPNGSGKSTLVRTLIGLVTPHSGAVRIMDAPPHKVPAGCIGYVPQIKSLDRSFPAQAIELVASASGNSWPGHLSASQRLWAREALDRVGAGHLEEHQVSTLSGGELQRVYLARALACEVQLLILDEPEAGIDAAGTSDLHALLEAYCAQGGTVVLVTHDWDAALHHATRVLLINREQIAFGAPKEALTDANIRQAFGHVGHAHAMDRGH